MRIASISAGAAGMYCGSCLHDNTLARALLGGGHEVALVPTYTPLRTDEEDVSLERVFYGAVNVYLHQAMPWTRRLPRSLAGWLDRPGVLRWVSRFAGATDARSLGALTLSVLRGEEGGQRRELEQLATWLGDFEPQAVLLPNSLFLGVAREVRRSTGAALLCNLSGEDLFLGQLDEPWRSRVYDELRRRAADVDVFLAPSRWYAGRMAALLEVPCERVAVVPLGISVADTRAPSRPSAGPPTIGYLARLAPEKGLHLLLEAFRIVAGEPAGRDARLRVAGYVGAKDHAYVEAQRRRLHDWGLDSRVEILGEVDREAKLHFLRSLDLLSVPTTYEEPKGLFVLEALAHGVPVVQPRHGSFPEMVEATGGGLLVEPGSAELLAGGLLSLLEDADRRRELGRRGRRAVTERFDDRTMAAATLAVIERSLAGRHHPGPMATTR